RQLQCFNTAQSRCAVAPSTFSDRSCSRTHRSTGENQNSATATAINGALAPIRNHQMARLIAPPDASGRRRLRRSGVSADHAQLPQQRGTRQLLRIQPFGPKLVADFGAAGVLSGPREFERPLERRWL
ncbi:MAG TPA: hypothetical protein VFE13_01195, partial [Caulobacteraceae bacterium]|nr:hypothetical protein [Caulobacteraceae bacterium]